MYEAANLKIVFLNKSSQLGKRGCIVLMPTAGEDLFEFPMQWTQTTKENSPVCESSFYILIQSAVA